MECKQWYSKDQSYEGTFLGDCFHGFGTYKRSKSDIYEGGFYSNMKEGYSVVSLPNNSNFEGLFIRNRPFGPGILTHSNGRQDAGFWVGQKLVRLSRPVDFIVPRLAPTVTAKIKLLQYRRLIPLLEDEYDLAADILNKICGETVCFQSAYSTLIYDPRSIFFDRPTFEANRFVDCVDVTFLNKDDKHYGDTDPAANARDIQHLNKSLANSVIVHHICQNDSFFMEDDDICNGDQRFSVSDIGVLTHYSKYGNFDGLENKLLQAGFSDFGRDDESKIVMIEGVAEKKIAPHIVTWNRGDLCTEITRQIYRHRAVEEKLNFKISELMSGIRTAFRKTGTNEKLCVYFLKMCSLGPPIKIKELLCESEISQELMDSRGNNALMFAAVADQLEIIDILSDYGVDVNAFNDEDLTPLNICLLRRLALQNAVNNWEVAFLPSVKSVQIDTEPGELQFMESIESLDRIFGDGMSTEDEKFVQEFEELQQTLLHDCTPEKNDNDLMSEITILNFKKSVDDTNENSNVRSVDVLLLPGNEDPTPDIKFRHVPKSNRREEFERSIGQSDADRYLFDLSLKEIPKVVEKEKKGTGKTEKVKKVEVEIIEEEEVEVPADVKKMLNVIDTTIEKLLERGADPNLSEVPKPSIHLAIFTRNLETVECLLRYGANSNRQLSEKEGLLTPLHVLVLLEPRQIYLDICNILLNYGANPEMETHPDFSTWEDEKLYLNQFYGRTPLHLLCMRPDIEYGDPFGHIINLGVKLAKVSDKKHFFNGHSGLTLAMFWGNTRLLEAFLKYNCFDPNKIVGEGLGTPLHVLVSTSLQKRTNYDVSIKMCDLLLNAGADPDLDVKTPYPLGTCVDYGYAEIEIEKTARKSSQKSSNKTDKIGNRDHLKDHIRVVEYLAKRREQRRTQTYLNELLADENSTVKTIRSRKMDGSGDLVGNTEKDSSSMKRVGLDDQAKQTSDGDANADKKNITVNLSSKKGLKTTKDVKKKSDGIVGRNKYKEKQTNADKEPRIPFSRLLLNALLEMFGGCTNLDVNQFALPYVVLRDGNFYYKFHKSVTFGREKEQYSLI